MSARDDARTATCEVWWATPSDSPDLLHLLGDAEVRRAERVRDPGDRSRFVTARALLRILLAARTGAAPSALVIDTTCHRCGADHGKPRLVNGGTHELSIAHSGNRVVVALTDDAVQVGVDVEHTDGPVAAHLADIAGTFLTPAELTDLRRTDPADRQRALAVWWTRKEAVLKATGDGLTVPMRQVSVTAPDEPAALRDARGRSVVALSDLTPRDGTAACVAAVRVSSLVVSEWDGDDLLARAVPPTSPVIS